MCPSFKWVLIFIYQNSLSCFGDLLYKTPKKNFPKVFGIFNFGHLFLSIFEKPRKILEKNQDCYHNFNLP